MQLEIYANGRTFINGDLNESELKALLDGVFSLSSVLDDIDDVNIIIIGRDGDKIFDGDLGTLELLSELF